MANSMRRSGGGFRNPLITSADLPDGGVTTTKLADLAVTSAKIADLAVTSAKIATAAITTAKIGDAQITSAKIASLSASKITSGTISAQTITIGSTGTIAGTNWEIAEDQWTIGGSTDFLRLDPSDNTVWGGSVTLESNLDGGKGVSGGSTFELTFGPGSTRPVTLISRYNNAGVVTAFTLLSYASGSWSFFGNVEATSGLIGDTLVLNPTHSNGQVALALNIERSWEFRQSGAGATTALRLASTSNKDLEIYSDTLATGIAISPSTTMIRRMGGSTCYIGFDAADQISMNVNSTTRAYLSTSLDQFVVELNGNNEMVVGLTGFLVPNVYNQTTASGANVVVVSGGNMLRSTSSRRYKTALRPWDHRSSVLDLSPTLFRSKLARDDSRRVRLGLIAEEVAERFPLAAVLDAEGRPDAIDWSVIAAGMLAELIRLSDRVRELESATLGPS